MPGTIGACIDALYQARAERLEYQRSVEEKLDALKAREKELEEHILQTFDKQQVEGTRGQLATASIARKAVPVIEDWSALAAHVVETGATDLLIKQVNQAAVRERWEALNAVPGVGVFHKVSLSLTKAPARRRRGPEKE